MNLASALWFSWLVWFGRFGLGAMVGLVWWVWFGRFSLVGLVVQNWFGRYGLVSYLG